MAIYDSSPHLGEAREPSPLKERRVTDRRGTTDYIATLTKAKADVEIAIVALRTSREKLAAILRGHEALR